MADIDEILEKSRPKTADEIFRESDARKQQVEEQNKFQEVADQTATEEGRLLYLQNEQSYLVDFIVANYNNLPALTLNKDEVTVLEGKSNEQFINETCFSDGFEEFLSITPSQQARIVPNIQFYKQFFVNGKTNSAEDQEFVFKNYTDLTNIEQITADRGFRGSACGIKDVKIDLDGKNPATGQFTSVSANFLFNDIQDIFSDTLLDSGRKISYADLFSQPVNNDGTFFNIKLVVGWNSEEQIFNRLDLKYTKMVLSLNLRSYSIELREDGYTLLKIEYIGQVENMLYDPSAANILKKSKQNQQKINELESTINTLELSKDPTRAKSKEEIEKLQKEAEIARNSISSKIPKEKRAGFISYDTKTSAEIQNEAEELRKTALDTVINDKKTVLANIKLNEKIESLREIFKNSNKIYTVSITKEQLEAYIKAIDEGSFDRSSVAVGEQPKQNNEEQIVKDSITVQKRDESGIFQYQNGAFGDIASNVTEAFQISENLFIKKYISFIFLGDLIQMLFEYVKDDLVEKYKQEIEIKLGEVIVVPPILNQKVRVSMAKLPVSLLALNNFFVNKIIGKSNDVYTFGQFIEEIVKELFQIALQQTGKNKAGYLSNNFDIFSYSVYKTSNGYTTLNDGPIEKMCLFFYSSTKDCNNVSLDYLTNINNKIPHYYFAGTDRGIVKSIKFSDNTSQKMSMAIYERSKQTNLENDTSKNDGVIQPKFYKITIRSIGNTFSTIGQTIYLDTNMIGINNNAKGRNLYVGGAYFVCKVSHTISKDAFETTTEATFQVPDEGIKNRTIDTIYTPDKISKNITAISHPDMEKSQAAPNEDFIKGYSDIHSSTSLNPIRVGGKVIR